jgi:hypothetical protein
MWVTSYHEIQVHLLDQVHYFLDHLHFLGLDTEKTEAAND